MKTKGKLITGISFLFLLIIIMGVTSIYYIRALDSETGVLIKENQRSIDYAEHMNRDMGKLHFFAVYALTAENSKTIRDFRDNQIEDLFTDFNNNLDSESHNITEKGEEKAVRLMKSEIINYKDEFYKAMKGDKNPDNILEINYGLQTDLNNIYELNKNALLEKSALETKTASKGVFYITIIGSAFILVAFVFLLSFPASIVPEKGSV